MLLLIDLPLGRTVWGRMGTASLWIAVSASPVMLWATHPWGVSWGGWTQVWSGDLGKAMGLQWLKTNESSPLKDPLVLSAENGKNKTVCFLGCLFGGSWWYYLKSDFSESIVSHRSTACFSASPGPSLPGMEDHISKQSDPWSHQANSKKGLPYWCSACWILTVFIHLRVAFRRREGEEVSAHAKVTTGLNVFVLQRRKG